MKPNERIVKCSWVMFKWEEVKCRQCTVPRFITELNFYVLCSVGAEVGVSLQEMRAEGGVSEQGTEVNI